MVKKSLPQEREMVIPLRERVRVVPRYKKTNKAVKTVQEYVAKHMRVSERDTSKVKVDQTLNMFLWNRGIRNPPHKVKVLAKREGDLIRVTLVDVPKVLSARVNRRLKRETKGAVTEEKKTPAKKEVKESPAQQAQEKQLEESLEKEGVAKPVAKKEAHIAEQTAIKEEPTTKKKTVKKKTVKKTEEKK